MSKTITIPVLFSMLFILALSTPGILFAQDTSEDFNLHDYASSTKVTIDFADEIPVSDFVAYIQQQAPELNVLIRSDVQNVLLPRLMLRNVTVDTALRSLEQLSLNALIVQLDDSEEYYVIGPDPDRSSQSVEVLNVSGYLIDTKTQSFSQEKKEHLMSAIEAGQQMLATSSGTLKISLHPTTGLLFVKGGVEETNLVVQIVDELISNPFVMSSTGSKSQTNDSAKSDLTNPKSGSTDK